jgi:hypothetical protein
VREVRVYDDARQTVWQGEVGPTEYALFHTDATTGRHMNAYGYRFASHWDRTCLVFEDLEEAQAYGRDKVSRVPALACRVYGPGPADGEPVEVIRNEEIARQRTMPQIKRRAMWGALWTVLGVICLWVEWWVYDWNLNLGILAASKLLLVGLTLLTESLVHAVNLRASAQAREGHHRA